MSIKRYNTLQENEPLGSVRPGDFRYRGCVEDPEGWLVTYTDHLAALASKAQQDGVREAFQCPACGAAIKAPVDAKRALKRFG